MPSVYDAMTVECRSDEAIWLSYPGLNSVISFLKGKTGKRREET
jgi:hypothetical protein